MTMRLNKKEEIKMKQKCYILYIIQYIHSHTRTHNHIYVYSDLLVFKFTS